MRYDCYHCGERIKVVDADEGDWIECPHCEASAPVPAARKQDRRRSFDTQPVILSVTHRGDRNSDIEDEELLDLRERRRYRNENRAGNPIGIAGFAIAVTTLLLLAGSMILCKSVPAYPWVVAVLCVPTSLLGLVFSIVGSLLVGRTKKFAVIGAAIGGFLMLVGIPGSFLLLKGI